MFVFYLANIGHPAIFPPNQFWECIIDLFLHGGASHLAELVCLPRLTMAYGRCIYQSNLI